MINALRPRTNKVKKIVPDDKSVKTIKENALKFLRDKIIHYTGIKIKRGLPTPRELTKGSVNWAFTQMYLLFKRPKWNFKEQFVFGDEKSVAHIKRWWSKFSSSRRVNEIRKRM